MSHTITPLNDSFFYEKNTESGIELTPEKFGITTARYNGKVFSPISRAIDEVDLRSEPKALTVDFVRRIESVREEVLGSIDGTLLKDDLFCLGMIEAMKAKAVREISSGAAMGKSDLEKIAKAIVRVPIFFLDPTKSALPRDWDRIEARQTAIVIEEISTKADPAITEAVKKAPKELLKLKERFESEIEVRQNTSISTLEKLEDELLQFFEKNGADALERRTELLSAIKGTKKSISPAKFSEFSSRFEGEKAKILDIVSLKTEGSLIEELHLAILPKGRDSEKLFEKIHAFATTHGQCYIPDLVKELEDHDLRAELDTKLEGTALTSEILLNPEINLNPEQLEKLKTALKPPSTGFFSRLFG